MQYYVRVVGGRPNSHNTEIVQQALRLRWPTVDWDVSACAEQDEGGHPMYLITPQTGDIDKADFETGDGSGTIKFQYSGLHLELF